MNCPYTVLGIGDDADDAVVREAYLALVRANPPESRPQRFQEVRVAFETLQTEKKRIQHRLFHFPEEPPKFEEFAAAVTQNCQPDRPERHHFQALLAESACHFGTQEN